MEVTVSQMKEIEKNADAHGLSYTQMMENAGQAAAQLLLKEGPLHMETAVVLCGSGNNGGDGFVLARALHGQRVWVELVLVESMPKTPDAILNWERAKKLGIPVTELENLTPSQKEEILTADAVVDAVYGTGFHGELRPSGLKAAELFNKAQGFKLALDLPSGLAADTGKAAQGAMRADMTVAFHAAKACHRLAAEYCGRVKAASIGIEALFEQRRK